MKKALSILLAVIMMCSFSMIAFAADPAVSLGTEYTVTAGKEAVRYSFTPSEDGMYKISAKILDNGKAPANADISVSLGDNYYSSFNLFYIDLTGYDFDIDIDISSFCITEDSDCFMAKRGVELTVEISNDSISFEDGEYSFPDTTVIFSITKEDNLREIKMGESYKVNGSDGEGEYFILKPTEDAVYNIWSYGCREITVMDLDGRIEGDYLYGEYPIDYTFEVEAGKMYGIYAETFSDSDTDPHGDPIFHVVDGTTISPDVIEAEDVTVVRGEDEYVFAAIYPVGARYNCGALDVKIGDEKIASAEYDAEDDLIIVHGKRLGKTTLTITEPISGVTTEVEVEVISKTANFFREIFYFISNIFNFIFGR